MWTDRELEFCDALSVVGGTGTAIVGSSTVYDLGQTTNHIAEGEPLYWVVHITTQIITGGTAGTIAFSLVSDANETTLNDSPTTHMTTVAVLTDDKVALDASSASNAVYNQFAAGITGPNVGTGGVWSPPAVIVQALPHGAYQRYLGVKRTIVTATLAGAISSFITRDPKGWFANRSYASS